MGTGRPRMGRAPRRTGRGGAGGRVGCSIGGHGAQQQAMNRTAAGAPTRGRAAGGIGAAPAPRQHALRTPRARPAAAHGAPLRARPHLRLDGVGHALLLRVGLCQRGRRLQREVRVELRHPRVQRLLEGLRRSIRGARRQGGGAKHGRWLWVQAHAASAGGGGRRARRQRVRQQQAQQQQHGGAAQCGAWQRCRGSRR